MADDYSQGRGATTRDSKGTCLVGEEILQFVLDSLKCNDLSGMIERTGRLRAAHGGYCEVFDGHVRFLPSQVPKKVAIKKLRDHILLDPDSAKVSH